MSNKTTKIGIFVNNVHIDLVEGDVCEIIFSSSLILVGRFLRQEGASLIFTDVLKVMATPTPTKKEMKDIKNFLFLPIFIPFRVVGEKSEIIVRKNSDSLLSISKVTLNQYLKMYDISLMKYNEMYVNGGLNVNDINDINMMNGEIK